MIPHAENDALNKKVKIIGSQLQSSLNDLEVFQMEKQAKMNEIWVVVPFEMRQIDFQENGLNVYSKKIFDRFNQFVSELGFSSRSKSSES